MPMPALPGAGLVVGQPQFRLGRLERVLNGPALPLHSHQDLDRRTSRTPGREECQIIIREAAPDQQAACPYTREILVVLISLSVGQLEVRPVVQAGPFRAVSG